MILQKINAGVFNNMVQDETGTFVMNKNQPSHVSSEIDNDTVKKVRELSKLRKSIELDLKAIATKTKISTNQLKNIESFKFEKLPPNPEGFFKVSKLLGRPFKFVSAQFQHIDIVSYFQGLPNLLIDQKNSQLINCDEHL